MIKHVLSLALVAAVLPASASARADGGRIYFLRGLSIFALDPAGGVPTLVRSVDGCNVTALAVSPDGSRLADADNRGSDVLPVWAAAPPPGGGSAPPPVVVAQPPAIAPAPAVTTPAPAPTRFTVHSRKLRVRKGVASLTLDVPGAGRARVSGKGLRTGDASARRAGKLTIALRLTSATLRHLRRAHTVKLRLDVRFTPVHACASDLRVTVTCDGSV